MLSIPAGHSVPERPIEAKGAVSEIDAARRLAEDEAYRRMRIPVNFCQGLLALIVLGSLACAALLLTSLLEGEYQTPSYSVAFFWISACLVQCIVGVIGIYGLQHALNQRSVHWSWTGILVSIAMGIVYLLPLPFAIWTALAIRTPEVADQFSSREKRW